MILEYNSKDPKGWAKVNNVKLLSVYAYFYYKNIYPGKLFLRRRQKL